MAYKTKAHLLCRMRFLSSYYQATYSRFFFLFVESAEMKKVLILALSKGAFVGKISIVMVRGGHPARGVLLLPSGRQERRKMNCMMKMNHNMESEVAV
jgi:hypothetical protein